MSTELAVINPVIDQAPAKAAPGQSMQYKTILADPPWTYRNRPPRGRTPYSTLTMAQLVAMGSQIRAVAAGNCHLYLWSTNAHLADALAVIEAWGFRYVQALIWFKTQMGLGSYFRHFTEPLLFSVRGNLRLLRRDLPSYFVERRTAHSRKPQAAYRLMEIASPAPRIELFARQRRQGWSTWGNEVDCDIDLYVPTPTNEMA